MRYQHNKKAKKSLALLLILALLAGFLPMGNNVPVSEAAGYGVSAPRTDSTGMVTWDCVWFGNYWQEDTNEDGTADKDDDKQPIKWRVLSVNGDDAFLVADQNLDVQRYNDTSTDVTWETCTMRSWLNGYGASSNACGKDYSTANFMNYAFTDEEQAAIKTTTVVNEDNPDYGTEGGNDTQDKVLLLSIGEAQNPFYGFPSTKDSTDTREARNTEYVADGGETGTSYMNSAGSADWWWLRSPGYDSNYASLVDYYGSVSSYGYSVNGSSYAVRPALHLNLSSDSGWSYAGTVSSDGGEIGQATPVPASSPLPASPTPVSPLPTTPTLASPTPPTTTPVATPPVHTGNTGTGQNVGTSGSGGASSPAGGSTLSAGNGDSANKVSAPAKVSLTSVKSKKETFTVVWKKVSGANGYEIQYALNKKFTKGKKKKLAKKTKLTVKKLKKKQYFVRVRAYVLQDGKKVYGAWSKVKKVKLKK